MNRLSRHLCVIAVLVIAGLIAASHAPAQILPGLENKTLTLGAVSTINEKEIENHLRDFIRYVARKLAPPLNIEGKVVVAPTLTDLARLLEQRKVDFYMESAYPTYVVNDVHDSGKLLLRRWQRGKAEYQSLIFAKKDSGVTSLEDLQGKVIAFEDPESTSGHFMPRFFLLKKGFKMVETNWPDATSSPPPIGFIFAYSQAKLVELVLTQQVAAGAFSDDDYANLDEKSKADIHILAQTEMLPRHLVSVRKDMPAALASRIEKILISMSEDAEGLKVLQKTGDTTRFDMLPGGEEGMRQKLLDIFFSAGIK
jgi:phosphonate transport system substrate-binding protein